MNDDITIQEQFFNELQEKIKNKHIIHIYITQSERQGMSTMNMRFNNYINWKLKKED